MSDWVLSAVEMWNLRYFWWLIALSSEKKNILRFVITSICFPKIITLRGERVGVVGGKG